jgi:hypothetical protein
MAEVNSCKFLFLILKRLPRFKEQAIDGKKQTPH